MELGEHTFTELAALIHRLTGLVMGKDKAYLVKHRLAAVAAEFGCGSFEEFAKAMRSPAAGRMHEAVIEAITTKETAFFRDAWFFDALAERVFPACAEALARPGG